MGKFKVRVPATTANLGPGFDAMGLALGLWNEATFALEGEGVRVELEGEGEDKLPRGAKNLIARATWRVYETAREDKPSGLQIKCLNRIPLGSGLGSSAAAVLAGLLGGNFLLGEPLSEEQIIASAVEMEGHADNVAAALYGGLVLVAQDGVNLKIKTIEVASWKVVVVIPNVSLPTEKARGRLPETYSREDVVFNLGRSAMVVEALSTGNVELLANVMEDKLHQPYRLPMIPGAEKAIEAAKGMGAAAALSGAGPGVVAFVREGPDTVAEAMQAAFEAEGVQARRYVLGVAKKGAEVMR